MVKNTTRESLAAASRAVRVCGQRLCVSFPGVTAQAAPGLCKAEATTVRHLPAQLPGHCPQQGRPTPAPAPAGPSPETHEVSKGGVHKGAGGGQGTAQSPSSSLLPLQRATPGLEGFPVGEEPEERHHGVISLPASASPRKPGVSGVQDPRGR